MFKRLSRLCFLSLFFLLNFSKQSHAQAADAQFAVITTLRTLMPKYVERYHAINKPLELKIPVAKLEEEKPIQYVRRARRISAAYEGFAIELLCVERPLLHDDPLFKKFGNVVYERTETGKYSYLIQVPFSSKESVDNFLQNVIVPRMPEARIAEYKNGKLF